MTTSDLFVKLSVVYYDDVAVMTLPTADHEVLFTRGLAYCGKAKSGGVVPDAALPGLVRNPTPARCRKLAGDLVRAGLWLREPGLYRIRSWEHWQEKLDTIDERRRRDRVRKAEKRAEARRTVRGLSADESANVHPTDKEEEQEGDAAASVGTQPGRPVGFPLLLHELRTALDDVKLTVRWDRLTEAQVVAIVGLVNVHGVARLVRSAQGQWRKDDPPAFAQAWIPGWEALPRAVPSTSREKCSEHDLEEPCRSCAADRKAGA